MIDDREGLLVALHEACELEHNLACLYLFAAFSLKDQSDGLTDAQQQQCKAWKDAVLRVAREEMEHLATVSNLLTAVGGAPHFGRPNFPQPDGYYSAMPEFTLERFSIATLKRFVEFERHHDAPRAAAIVPEPLIYRHVGELYALIRAAFERLDEAQLFIGPPGGQDEEFVGASVQPRKVANKAEALQAIDDIVEVGEGTSTAGEQSHYQVFLTMFREYQAAAKDFDAARRVCSNPLTRPQRGASQANIISLFAVGRLDPTGGWLDNYITALLGDWKSVEARSDRKHALVWSVNHGESDITHLMATGLAAPLCDKLSRDGEIQVERLDAQDATHGALNARLAATKPRLIVTTSHGSTGPLGPQNRVGMRANLGLSVDQSQRVMKIADLMEHWAPGGAIWYAHACCSAGGDSKTIFQGLVKGRVAEVLAGVAELGAAVAPLPSVLLGAKQPLRAFIGHVEPTFDWTLSEPSTGQLLTDGLVQSLYTNLYLGDPVGHALRSYYLQYPAMLAVHDQASRQFNNGTDTEGIMMAALLCARDVSSTVVLGDPAVSLFDPENGE